MDLEGKIRFALSTVGPMAHYTFPFIASVFGVTDEGKKGEHVGSALRCLLNGQRAIVTAWHVFDQAMTYNGFAVSTGPGRPPYPVSGELHYSEEFELAVYFVPPDFPAEGVAFWPEERLDLGGERRATDYLFIHGFPRVQTAFSSERQGAVSRSLPYGCMQCLERPSNLRSFEFALEFDPRGMQARGEIPDAVEAPHGLSGSPVWRIGASGRPVRDWSPDWSLLAGIVTQWDPKEQVLIATAAEGLVQLLSQVNLKQHS